MSTPSDTTHLAGCILVVDDEPDIRQLVCLSLSRIGIDTHGASNLAEARELLRHYRFDACLTDMRLPDGNGVDFVAELAGSHPDLPVAVITAHGQMNAAIEAMKNGAFDFVSKPVDLTVLRRLATQAMTVRDAADPTDVATPKPSRDDGGTSDHERSTLAHGERLVGNAPPLQELRERIAKVARTNAPVWITGESGTGKELIAQLIHANGPRAQGPFVAINCGAIPAELMESELFGHRKGAFTGAHQDKEGLIRSAEGGTLLLDEIAELPLHMQVKLLRVIQERTVRPVGDNAEYRVDVRLLSASHADLAERVAAGHFRQDLYYRLNVISIRSPALRERRGDIPALAEAILSRLAGDACAPGLAPDALVRLSTHAFPGNVRELENVLERAYAMATGASITARDLEIDGGTASAPESFPNEPSDSLDDERARIVTALEHARWNRKRAADALGMTYRQLRYRIAQYGLDEDDRAA